MTATPLRDAQARALDPQASVWVSASAGSGKTQLLSDRVIRLMVGGTAPSRILCLTFTRAAAAEMAGRVNDILARYATESDDALDKKMKDLLGRAPSEAERLRARRLFAQVLDVPGGLRVMTIHAFCQSLLRRFPIEADVAPHFEVVDEAGQRDLIEGAAYRLFSEASPTRESDLASAWRRLSPFLNEKIFFSLVGSLRTHRERLARLRATLGGTDGLIDAVRARLGLEAGMDEWRVFAEAAREGAFDREGLARAAEALARHGSKTDIERAAAIGTWLARDDAARATTFDDYAGAFLTRTHTPLKALATKAVLTAVTETLDILSLEQARVAEVVELHKRALLFADTAALLRLEVRFSTLYAREKARAATLDFDDQIDRARRLLEEKAAGAWVLYKLDGGLDHILVDEAQDTAPAQWRVVEALVEEFYSGLGAREARRTLFAVGDEKQSIFSFQGADLAALEAVRERVIARARDAELPFDDVPLVRSFRSTAPVLKLVDAVFADEAARAGVSRAGEPIAHLLMREGQAGLVELWPLLEREEPEEAPARVAPTEQAADDDPERRLAHYLAARIRHWLHPQDAEARADAFLPARGRAMRAGDILVLVRHRTALGPTLIAALKSLGIPVAGVDRLALTDQLAVKDLMALGEALLLPQDDLTFACLLKSPLFGFDDEKLFQLAHGRGDHSLWHALVAQRDRLPAFTEAHDRFSRLLARADFMPPFELFAGVLAEGGRAALLQRLGPEANDAIDEFLARALDFERTHAHSLQAFLHWLRSGQSEVKRDGEKARDEVRVMTVHGAKGLQAPVVILADTVSEPKSPTGLTWTIADHRDPPLPLYPIGSDYLSTIASNARAAEKQRQQEELRRLLYVALTRAEDRLYVAGHAPKKKLPEDCWYRLIAAGFERLEGAARLEMSEPAGPKGTALRLEARQTAAKPDRPAPDADLTGATPALPGWARRPPPPEAPARSHIAASERFRPDFPVASPLESGGAPARRRGRIIHRLLELVPTLAPSKRRRAIERYLARPALGLGAPEREEIRDLLLRVIESPEMTLLFGPESLGEVPLAAEIGGTLITGQVDRLAITPNRVLVIDYKTGASVPERPEDAPPAYAAQLATYRAILARLYADRPICCGLLYTDRPVLHWLQESVLSPFAP